MRQRVAPLVAPAAFAVATAVLALAGGGRLSAPSPLHLGSWVDEVGPIVAAMSLVRLAALAAASVLLVTTAVSAGARLVGARRVADAVDAALPAPVRGLLAGLAGIGAVGAMVVGAAGQSSLGAAASAPEVERLVRLADDPPQPPPVETMSVLADEPQAPAAQPQEDRRRAEWTVEPGDSFWSIAEEVLADRLGRAPTDVEIIPFWRSVIDANRDRLRTGDADLVYPGQVFVVPPS